MIELTIRKPGEPERRMLLPGGVYALGRQEDNEIVLADREVSRRHARLLVDQDTAVVEDLGSGNGTWVSGRRVDRHVLADGEEIEILPFLVRVRVGAAPAPRRIPALVVTEGRDAGRHFVLSGDRVTVGRGADQDVRLSDKGASRAHAVLARGPSGWTVRDLDAPSGVYVNDQRVGEAPIEPGDRITVGDTVLRFEISAGAAPTLPPNDELLDDDVTSPDAPSPGPTAPRPSAAPALVAAPPTVAVPTPAPVNVRTAAPGAAPVPVPPAPVAPQATASTRATIIALVVALVVLVGGSVVLGMIALLNLG